MRKFTVEEPIEEGRNNDNIILAKLIYPLADKIRCKDLVTTGCNASQSEGQESYAEIMFRTLKLDPYSPYLYIDKKFSTPKKYVKNELDWYKSMDLSIIGHEGIESNPTWQACCTQDDKKLINSNYGWCVFSEENGSQYDNCLDVLSRDPSTRNAIIMYNRPSIYAEYKRDGMHDMICTLYSQFFIRNNELIMIHNMRSNDIKFGLPNDLAWNCFVYQNMYADLKEYYPSLEKGHILWTSNSMHVYARHYSDILNIAKSRTDWNDKNRW